jgi:hypothetical protein
MGPSLQKAFTPVRAQITLKLLLYRIFIPEKTPPR